jgi:trk system potassium uptake protein TrkH
MSLIVIGGIGFYVWWDVIYVIRKWRKTGVKNCFWKLKLHTKIVLTMTVVLILTGAMSVFFLEYNNPATLGSLTFFEKIQASFFQSVTTRTAGFFTVDQAGLRESTALISSIFMFIGGSPAGTAGGVKTMTIAMMLAVTMSIIQGEKDTVVYRRTIPKETVRRALAVFIISIVSLIGMIVMMSIIQPAPLVDILYEVTSALATVGLSRNLTGSLNLGGKLIIILCMYIGRIGPISMVIAFRMRGKGKDKLNYVEEDIIVG